MSKPKLLITMGCSFTEGVGCYDVSKMTTPMFYAYLPKNESLTQKHNFHKHGWPNRLGKKLGYDKVINLGLGGSSTSGQVKQFFEKYANKDLSQWDVLIVWLLPEPSRISFYKDGRIENYLANSPSTLVSEYIKLVNNALNTLQSNRDFLLEHIFYIKIIEQFCESNDYSLLMTPLYSRDLFNQLTKLYKSNYYLIPIADEIIKSLKYACNIPRGDIHFNEEGYELLANKMYNEIKSTHPHLVSPSKDKIKWIWDGDVCVNLTKYYDLDNKQ